MHEQVSNSGFTGLRSRVTFFDASTGELHQKLEWKGSLVSMVLSPNGEIVACGSQDNSVHFWRRSTEQDAMMSGYPGKPSALAFDDAGTLLATGGGDAVTVWSFQEGGPEGTRPGVLEHHVQPVTTLAFARRGMRLASAARDGAVVVWSLQRDGRWNRPSNRGRGSGGHRDGTVLASRRARACRARRPGWRDGLADRMNKGPSCPRRLRHYIDCTADECPHFVERVLLRPER